MKNFLLGLLILISLLPSCTTNINVNAPYKDVTIVYGLLDFSDSVQYIRIEKGFLDKTTSALTLAKIPDSIYYGTILKVQLVSLTNKDSLTLQRTSELPKDTGKFANTPNILYKLSQPIDPAQNYKLVITNTSNGNLITAQTSIVQSFVVSRPSPIVALQSPLNLAGFNSDGTAKQVEVQWTAGKNAIAYDVIVRFYYQEWNISDPSVVKDTFVDWNALNNIIAPDTLGGQSLLYYITGNDFYHVLATSIAVDPTKKRQPMPTPIEFRFTAGGPSLYNYLFSSQISTSITALQAQTKYSNINNGIGIFSSRSSYFVSNLSLNSISLDSLACGSITGNLNFSVPGVTCQ